MSKEKAIKLIGERLKDLDSAMVRNTYKQNQEISAVHIKYQTKTECLHEEKDSLETVLEVLEWDNK